MNQGHEVMQRTMVSTSLFVLDASLMLVDAE